MCSAGRGRRRRRTPHLLPRANTQPQTFSSITEARAEHVVSPLPPPLLHAKRRHRGMVDVTLSRASNSYRHPPMGAGYESRQSQYWRLGDYPASGGRAREAFVIQLDRAALPGRRPAKHAPRRSEPCRKRKSRCDVGFEFRLNALRLTGCPALFATRGLSLRSLRAKARSRPEGPPRARSCTHQADGARPAVPERSAGALPDRRQARR